MADSADKDHFKVRSCTSHNHYSYTVTLFYIQYLKIYAIKLVIKLILLIEM